MCKIAKVSKSGYYKWLRNKDKISFKDILDYTLVKDIFFTEKEKIGIRRIKMKLEDIYGKIMNRKKIARIMKELNLKTRTRRKNPYKTQIKKNCENFYCENLLQQNFKNKLPYKALGIDITYLKYNARFAYLCVLLDVKTTEIISYALSRTMSKELALATIDGGLETAPASPRDNAVIESFFGHLKDEIDLKGIKTFEQVVATIDNYMYYYNNERRQWNKNRMTPVEYRKFLMAS